jgi:hypothetical protein
MQSEFQIAAKLALGCSQYPVTTIFCNICNEITDLKGDHATFYKKESSTNQRHDRIRDFIFSIASQGCLNVSKEMKNLFEGQERPAAGLAGHRQIFIYPIIYKEGKDYLFDTGIIYPTGFGLLNHAAVSKNYAADTFDKAKTRKAASKIVNTNYVGICPSYC